MVLPVGSRRFSMVLVGSQWFLAVLVASQWFSLVHVGSRWFSVIVVGSQRFSGQLRQGHQYKNCQDGATWAHKDSYCGGRTNNEQ